MQERHADDASLGEAVQLDPAETLTGDPGDDPLDSGYVPPDRPSALSRARRTPSEEANGESLEEKLDRETEQDPEALEADRAGRLVGPPGDDVTATDIGLDGGAARAEEAAVHEQEGPA